MRTFIRVIAGLLSTIEIVLRDNGTLAYVQTSGATLELEPLRGSTFRVRDRAGWTLEFRRVKDAVTEAALRTPGSSTVLKRL